jgi:hypothetical protein
LVAAAEEYIDTPSSRVLQSRTMLRSYLRLVVFAIGLLAGVQIPGFIDQYAKRVDAHYIEARNNFAGFQKTADQYFKGDVDALIAHNSASTDVVIQDEAKTIALIYARVKSLAAELEALRGGLLARIVHVALRPNRDILSETIAAYSYTVPLNADAVLCGVTLGFVLAFTIESVLLGLAALLGQARPPGGAYRPPPRPRREPTI